MMHDTINLKEIQYDTGRSLQSIFDICHEYVEPVMQQHAQR
jgi:hypothetical protein